MELIAYTVVAGYVILMAVCGYLRLQIEQLRKVHFELRERVTAQSRGLQMLYEKVYEEEDEEQSARI